MEEERKEEGRNLQLILVIGRVGVKKSEQFCHAAGSKKPNVSRLVVLDERLHQHCRQRRQRSGYTVLQILCFGQKLGTRLRKGVDWGEMVEFSEYSLSDV